MATQINGLDEPTCTEHYWQISTNKNDYIIDCKSRHPHIDGNIGNRDVPGIPIHSRI